MRTLDPGHVYLLHRIDGSGQELLTFVKRTGPRYPGNKEPAHAGTTLQEVLRAVIDRSEYVNHQIPCAETEAAIGLLKTALLLFEIRAKRVKGKTLEAGCLANIVHSQICGVCGHVYCREQHA